MSMPSTHTPRAKRGRQPTDAMGLLASLESRSNLEQLHVIYEGVRVLGSDDDVFSTHAGVLTPEALERAGRGVVRTLQCRYSPIADPSALAALLQGRPNALLQLDVAGMEVRDRFLSRLPPQPL